MESFDKFTEMYNFLQKNLWHCLEVTEQPTTTATTNLQLLQPITQHYWDYFAAI